MNELQIALFGFGVMLVGAVWGYNLWQEKRQRQRGEAVLPARDEAAPDVLMAGRAAAPPESGRSEPAFVEPRFDAGMREPTFDVPEEAPAEESVSSASTFAPATENDVPESVAEESAAPDIPAQENTAAMPRHAAALPSEWADGRADCLLRIEFPDPVSVTALWADQSDWVARIDKPMQWLGLDEQTGRWRSLLPQDAHPVMQVAAALQLADRRGVVSDATLAAFVDGVHQIAQRYAGLVELPQRAAVLERASALDEFCAGVDLQLALYVVPRPGSLTEMVGARLKPEIEAAGLRLEGERFIAVDLAEAEVFSLICHAAAPGAAHHLDAARLTALALSIDVPRVANGAAGFDRMLAVGRRCAEALGGQLVDAQKKPLAEATIAAIRQRIEDLQGRMAAHDIPAGGVRALRLFA